jgi:hypothetical protein
MYNALTEILHTNVERTKTTISMLSILLKLYYSLTLQCCQLKIASAINNCQKIWANVTTNK